MPETKRILFLGAESTGKSTLMREVSRIYDCPGIHEYGRELWEEKSGDLTFDDHTEIGRVQIQREEEAALLHPRFIICDTSALTTLFYSLSSFSKASEALFEMAKRPYDLVFLNEPDFPLVQDGTRSDETFRSKQHRWYLDELSKRNIPYLSLSGSFASRLKKAQAAIESLK